MVPVDAERCNDSTAETRFASSENREVRNSIATFESRTDVVSSGSGGGASVGCGFEGATSHRHLRLLPLLRADATHSGHHHTRGDCRRAPRCSASAARRCCRTTPALLGTHRCPLSLCLRALRTALVAACLGVAWGPASVPVAACFALKWLRSHRLSFARHPPSAPRRSFRTLPAPVLLLNPRVFPLHFT